MKKKILGIIVASMLFAGIAGASSYGSFEGFSIIRVQSNGQTLAVEDVPAVNLNGRTMVPIYMLRNLGMDVQWDGNTSTVNVSMAQTASANVSSGINIDSLYELIGKNNVKIIEYASDGRGFRQLSYVFTFALSQGHDDAYSSAVNAGLKYNVTQVRVEDAAGTAFFIKMDKLRDYFNGVIDENQFLNSLEYVSGEPIKAAAPESANAKEIAKLMDRVAYVEIYDQYGNVKGSGSGFVISPGYFITNYHVAGEAGKIIVYLDGKKYDSQGRYLFFNKSADIWSTILAESYDANGYPKGKIPTKTLEYTTDLPEVGDKVYAIGSPSGLENTFSEGIVSGIRTIDGITYIQHTADTESGSSGGVLLNDKGQAIGVTTMGAPGTTLDFAVPMSYVQAEIDKLD